MKMNKVLADVIQDFNRKEKCEVSNPELEKVLLSIVEPLQGDLGVQYVYAVFMCSLYTLQETEGDLNVLQGVDVKEELYEMFDTDIETLKDQVVAYLWKPPVLERVMFQGFEIFEVAKSIYFLEKTCTAKEDVDCVYSQIVKAREDLEFIRYIYRSKKAIMRLYEAEFAEIQKDMELINGTSTELSERLTDYLESYGYIEKAEKEQEEITPDKFDEEYL